MGKVRDPDKLAQPLADNRYSSLRRAFSSDAHGPITGLELPSIEVRLRLRALHSVF